MTHVTENTSLKAYNTFGINVMARYFSAFSTAEELAALLETTRDRIPIASGNNPPSAPRPPLILGGGSNILFTGNIDGLVLHNQVKGIQVVREEEIYVYVKVGAGDNCHGFVQHCLQRNWAGV